MDILSSDITIVVCEVIAIVIILLVNIHFTRKRKQFLSEQEKAEKSNQERLLQKSLENKKRSN